MHKIIIILFQIIKKIPVLGHILRLVINRYPNFFILFRQKLFQIKIRERMNASIQFHALNKKNGLYDNLFEAKSKKRILMDVSVIANFDNGTGIQRVVKNILYELINNQYNSTLIIPVELVGNQFFIPIEWLIQQNYINSSRFQNIFHNGILPLDIQEKDTLLMLDSSWDSYAFGILDKQIEMIREKGGHICTVVYDLLPIKMPEVFESYQSYKFKKWLDKAVITSDSLLCISKTVSEELKDYIKEENLYSNNGLKIDCWHLGANILPKGDFNFSSNLKLENIFKDKVFLMVGTIEPRKGHAFVLDAFEILWKKGHQVKLCIVGKKGWMTEDLLKRIRLHPENGHRLFYLDYLTDKELNFCYKSATALIIASKGEGFGLPIIEAAQFGIPIIASDIPVFREIGKEHLIYFSREDPIYLVNIIENWQKLWNDGLIPDSKLISPLSWKQSAEQLLDKILESA